MNEIKRIAASMFRLSLTAMVGVVIGHGSVIGLEWKEVLGAGAFAGLIVLYNYLNPSDRNYGKTTQDENKI